MTAPSLVPADTILIGKYLCLSSSRLSSKSFKSGGAAFSPPGAQMVIQVSLRVPDWARR